LNPEPSSLPGPQILESLLESRHEGIALVDAATRYIFVNRAYARIMKEVFNLKVGPGERHQCVLPEGQRARASDICQQARAGRCFTVGFNAPCPEGGLCYFERSFSPVYEKERLAGFSEIIRDVTETRRKEALFREACGDLEKRVESRTSTFFEHGALPARKIGERQQVEEDLLESRERLAQILHGSSIPTFVIDENHTITHWNRACAKLTGYGSNEMVGSRNQWKAFYHHQRPTLADLVVEAASEEQIARFYSGKYRPSSLLDGAYEAEDLFAFGDAGRWLFFTAAPIRNRFGETIGAIETLQDVTDRKRMEEKIRQMNDALEARVEERSSQLKLACRQLLHAEKLSAIGKLAASIAHEFGNPIIGIRNFLKRLRRNAELDHDDSVMLDLAIAECVRIKDLISSLQDFNRPTSGRIAPVDLHRIIDDLLLFSRKKLQDKHITVVRDFAPALPPVQAVADQIKQVLLNVLANAEEAIPATGGRIRISTRVEGDQVRISIKDNGRGISPRDMPAIFEPFFSTKPAVEGTGLGLSVSYGIVRRHGGEITASSDGRKGAVFVITLPIDGGEAIAEGLIPL
jgi:signal transduction histidine kinase